MNERKIIVLSLCVITRIISAIYRPINISDDWWMDSLGPPSRDSSEITGGPSPLLCPIFAYLAIPLLTRWELYAWTCRMEIQVKTRGCRYCMPQYKHNLIMVTDWWYPLHIKGGLLSFLHLHVCISFSHSLLGLLLGKLPTPLSSLSLSLSLKQAFIPMLVFPTNV